MCLHLRVGVLSLSYSYTLLQVLYLLPNYLFLLNLNYFYYHLQFYILHQLVFPEIVLSDQ